MNKYTLPLKLKPRFETELIRLGKKNDGGYLISKKSLDTSNKLYSFGLDDDYSFERDFFKKTNVEVICYDQTVNFKFFLKPFLFGHFSKLFQYLGYRFFFDGKKRKHIKKISFQKEHFY